MRGCATNEPDVKKVIDTAKGVEGLVRQMGVHAAGVIMSSEPIVDHAPIWVRHTDGVTITQWDYPQCESLGLIKMDFLGLQQPHHHGRRRQDGGEQQGRQAPAPGRRAGRPQDL
ncbi:hypothetical protein ACRAWF_29725 [Streptomyces sp. L7]